MRAVAAIATAHERGDLRERMAQRVDKLDTQTVRVLVAGDFKQGKSTLVNALIDHEICPAHPDFATSVPTAIHHGAEPSAIIYRDVEEHELPVPQGITLDQVGRFVSETEGAGESRLCSRAS